MSDPLLEVNELSISFTHYTKGLRQTRQQVISNLSLAIHSGEIVAVVGASGSGKSLLAHAILGILPENATMSGTITYDGTLLTARRQLDLRGRDIALVPQSVNFLDPLMRVGAQVRSAVKTGEPAREQQKVFARYRLGDKVAKLFPFQLSGGMARRTLVSTAVVSGARLIIADEPTPGLDPEALRQALGYFKELAASGAAVMLITHDIGSALTIADRIAVFYAGTTVEITPAADFAEDGRRLRHPYTQALWRALPQNEFIPTGGSQPAPGVSGAGCPFAPRCELAIAACREEQPMLRSLRDGWVRCDHVS
ncbi:peptide ABC transporter ATP-binding protein [Ammoniphilus oxalaticus]|uniref:Nickel import system ATP-binding protein NikD n=1 Tax=Ammoniphilus oxalaticus TaxID=66863 RepID=A0A419SGR9_9BACL|nr:ABC transporter ATP-binding protein [Ammoniphilus oxalaticus]RKD23001.1 peptide ABC transporter ATP-binding protein [Ammoniphilus oxalaticus]